MVIDVISTLAAASPPPLSSPLPSAMLADAWVHDLDPVAFSVFGFAVRWYGLSYIAGFVLAALLIRWMAKRGLTVIRADRVIDLLFYLMVGVLAGGRLGYVIFYQPSLLWTFTDHVPFWGAIAINDGGMASHGGIIGVIVATILFARREKVSSLHALDVVATAAPLGLGLGRLANFVNGELLGRIVAQPGEAGPWWSVRYPQELLSGHAPVLDVEQASRLEALLIRIGGPESSYAGAASRLISAIQHGSAELKAELAPLLAARHPSQLYQAFAEGFVLFAALAVVWMKPRRAGVVGCWFLMVYGALRIATEHWRLPDDHLQVARVLGLSRGQWLSAAMVIVGVAALVIISRRPDAPEFGGWMTRGKKEDGRRKPAVDGGSLEV